MKEENKIVSIELSGTRDLTKFSFIKSQGLKGIQQKEEMTPKANVLHTLSVNNENIFSENNNSEIYFIADIELNQGINNFIYQNNDNFGWDISLSLNGKKMFQTKKGNYFQSKIKVGSLAMIPLPQSVRRIKSKTKAKLFGFQFGGKLRERLQNIGKQQQNVEEIAQVQQVEITDEFAEDVGEKSQPMRKYLSSLGGSAIGTAREKMKKGRLGLFSSK